MEKVDWTQSVEPPQIVSSSDAVEWESETDLVIVGLGGAGVSAAAEALDRGLSVYALDRFEGGGATKASGGVVYLGGGTKTQKEAGVSDTPENMLAYLKQEVGDIISPDTLQAFCAQSSDNEAWLTQRGVRFEGKLWNKKTSYPNAEYYLYHSDNSLLPTYAKTAEPAARGHRGWVPLKQGRKAMNLGGSIYDPLLKHAETLGLKTSRLADVRSLVIDERGRVLGVKAYVFEQGSEAAIAYRDLRARALKWMTMYPPILPGSGLFFKRGFALSRKAAELLDQRVVKYYRARRGVVISAGGFAYNRSMMKAHAPKFARGYPLGTEGDDGAGIRLGQSAGGAVGNMSRVTAWRFINPPFSFARGLIVNETGERFINEMVYGAALGVEIGERQNGKAWLILDKGLVKSALAEVSGSKALPFQRDLARLNVGIASNKASSLQKLARKTGLPPDALEQSVAHYNEIAQGNAICPFGKPAGDAAHLARGHYYAIDIGLAAKLFPCPVLTLGGLKIEESSGAVLSADNVPVPGLYAAGRSAIGVCSWNYVSGLSIADCVFSGRRAASSLSETKETK